jgi:hypothetical protein
MEATIYIHDDEVVVVGGDYRIVVDRRNFTAQYFRTYPDGSTKCVGVIFGNIDPMGQALNDLLAELTDLTAGSEETGLTRLS